MPDPESEWFWEKRLEDAMAALLHGQSQEVRTLARTGLEEAYHHVRERLIVNPKPVSWHMSAEAPFPGEQFVLGPDMLPYTAREAAACGIGARALRPWGDWNDV